MSYPFRTELVAENTIFGTQQSVWKEILWGKSVLEENIRTLRFTTGGSLRMLSVGILIQSFERQVSETVLQLPPKKLCWYRLHFASACLVRMYCIIKRTINTCESFHAHFNALFYSVHHKIFVLVSALQKKYRMRPTSKWEVPLREDLENQLHSNKRT